MKFDYKALGRLKPGEMNKTEQAYKVRLDEMLYTCQIKEVKFEPLKLRLAARTFYTPDFMVINHKNEIEFHEVKGFWTDDARVKIKVAAEQYPYFRFIAVKKNRDSWIVEEF